MKKNLLIGFFVIIIFSCKSDDSEFTNIETTLIAKWTMVGIGVIEGINKQNIIITNKSDWDILINQMDSSYKDGPCCISDFF